MIGVGYINDCIEYIPILTTAFSFFFLGRIWKHYQVRKTKYLLWWSLGVLTFGVGTFSESINVLFGWSVVNFKLWYISGALLGGYPLAQGSIYLLMNKRFATWSAYVVVTTIIVASICVIFSPINLGQEFSGKLDGSALGWQWVRRFSPPINIYAALFLCGGAIYSAVMYRKKTNMHKRFVGNIYIALGALLPGIGGSFTRFGYVNVLFITELVGLLLIYVGYVIIKQDKQKESP